MATVAVNYFYIGDAPGVSSPIESYPVSDTTAQSKDYNPIFNFNQQFVNDCQSISSIEMGQSIPYISLKRVDDTGKIVQDFNVNFLTKQIDFEGMRSPDKRFSDRPIMSLKDITISSDLASGYLQYTKVLLALKVHSPAALQDGPVLALLTPNVPLRLEYGWNSPNPLLNKKEVLLFAPYNYQLTMDVAGQIDLTVEAMAYHENFNNTLLGDEAQTLVSSSYFNGGNGSISSKYAKLQDQTLYLNNLDRKKGAVDYDYVRSQLSNFETEEKKARGLIAETYHKNLKTASGMKTFTHEPIFDMKVKPPKKTGKTTTIGWIPLHDLVYAMCDKTLQNLTTLMPGAKELRVVYGRANDSAGKLKSVSLAEFNVRWEDLVKKIGKEVAKGNVVLTVQKFFNILVQDFLNNEKYYNHGLSDKEKETFVMPQIIFNFTNYKENDKVILEIQIIDTKSGFPETSRNFPKPGTQAAPDTLEKNIRAVSPNMPIIRIGHANAFVKSVSFSQISDEHMKAVLISRMQQSAFDANSPPGMGNQTSALTPLQLPLKGTMELVGQIDWKIFRAFYLDAGLFLVNGVYKIISVVHKLSHTGYTTTIEFLYH